MIVDPKLHLSLDFFNPKKGQAQAGTSCGKELGRCFQLVWRSRARSRRLRCSLLSCTGVSPIARLGGEREESFVCIIYVSNSDSLSIQSIQLVPILSKSIPLRVTLIETALNLVGLACVGGHIKVFSSMNVWMYQCMSVCMSACLDVCMSACLHFCRSVGLCVCMDVWIDASMHACMHTFMHVCMYMYVCKCMFIVIYIYIYCIYILCIYIYYCMYIYIS